MKSKICLIVLLLSLKTYAQNSYARKAEASDVTNVLKLTVINPGVSYEFKVGSYQTIYGQCFMNNSIFHQEYENGTVTNWYFDPAITLQYRYYYNSKQRAESHKRTAVNSMNYFSLVGETFFSKIPLKYPYYQEKDRRAVNKLGVCWGLQRNTNSRFSFDLNLGLGYLFSNATMYNSSFQLEKANVSKIAFLGQVNIGFWLSKRPKEN